MSSSLIRGKYVICKALSRSEALILEDGAVYQENGTIVEVGSYSDLSAKYHPDQVLGSAEDVVMPGFVNSHHHVGLTPFQLGSPDYPLELWFASRMVCRPVNLYLDTLYSAFEMIESGITTVQHIHGWLPGTVTEITPLIEKIFQAYADIGMRVSYSFAVRDQNRLVYEADEDFVKRLPPDIAPDIESRLQSMAMPLDDYFVLFEDLWSRFEGSAAGRIRIQLAPANLHWCTDEALHKLKEYTDRYNVGMHMHLVETIYQKEYAQRRFGKTAIGHLNDLGFLGPHLTLGHGVWLTEADLDLIASTGTMICHNASSNLRLQSGIAPLNAFEQKGISVGMGLDEAGINDDRDMLQEMRMVLKLHRIPGHDNVSVVPTCPQVFRMATEHGAKTTRFGDQIGTLEAGKAADLVVMNWKHIAYPYLDEEVPILDAVLHRSRNQGVETVMVNGEVILSQGKCSRIDKEAILEELAASLKVPFTPEELRQRQLAHQVFPHVKNFYKGWIDHSQCDPFYCQSARH